MTRPLWQRTWFKKPDLLSPLFVVRAAPAAAVRKTRDTWRIAVFVAIKKAPSVRAPQENQEFDQEPLAVLL